MDTETYTPFTFDESPRHEWGTPPTEYPQAAPPAPPVPPVAPERPARRHVATAVVAASAALFGAGAGVVVTRELAPPATTVIGNETPPAPVAAAAPGTYVEVAAKVLPSVVSLAVSGMGGSGSGSGVVIRNDGYILTNNHVVEGASTIRATFNDGSSAGARVVGADAASDLAVVKVDKAGLKAATIGRSASVRVGDNVLAVGSPLGLSGTVTAGIVSALNRPVNTTERQLGGTGVATVIDAIQTDAAINPGNSGGALVDMAGQVIGINSAIASTSGGSIGVGFAIPIDQAKAIAQQLIDTGRASRAQIGVSVAEATTANGEPRVILQAVTPGGPADAAGLRAGDAIVQIGTHKVTDADSLIAAVRAHRPGTTVEVTYERDGKRQTASVRLTDAATG
jgi:putative serine protease PepD